MPQAVVHLDSYVDRVLNIVKAKNGFKRKDEALNYVVTKYGEEMLEPVLRPDYAEKIEKIMKTDSIRVHDFAKRYGLK